MGAFVSGAADRVTEGEAIKYVLDLNEPLIAKVDFLVDYLLWDAFGELRQVVEGLTELLDLRTDEVIDPWVSPLWDHFSQNFFVEVFADHLKFEQVKPMLCIVQNYLCERTFVL